MCRIIKKDTRSQKPEERAMKKFFAGLLEDLKELRDELRATGFRRPALFHAVQEEDSESEYLAPLDPRIAEYLKPTKAK